MSEFFDENLYRARIDGFNYDLLHSDKFLFPSCHFFCILDGRMLYITRTRSDVYRVVSNFFPASDCLYTFDGDPIKPRMSRMGFYTLYSSDDLYACVRAYAHYVKVLRTLLVKNWIDFEPIQYSLF